MIAHCDRDPLDIDITMYYVKSAAAVYDMADSLTSYAYLSTIPQQTSSI